MADNVIVRVPEQQFIRGEDGYSPVVTVEEIEHGHSVTITDRDHPEGQSFDVLDGDSAYEQAVAGGYTGAEAQFNEDLTNFKTLHDETEEVAPFYAEYGVTTKAEIEAAINGKRQIYAYQSLSPYPPILPYVGKISYADEYSSGTGYRFSLIEGTTQTVYELTSAWAYRTNNLAEPAQRAEAAAAQALARMNSADASAQAAEDASNFFTSTILPNAVTTINNAKDQAVSNVNVAKSTAVQNVQAEGATQISAVQTESTTQQAAIQQKGDDVLESIPEDYTELSDAVNGDIVDIDPGTLTFGYVNTINGGIYSSSSGLGVTDYIDIHDFVKIAYLRLRSTSATATTGMCFYDANKVWCGGIVSLKSQPVAGYDTQLTIADVPDGAYYARFTGYIDTATYGDFVVKGIKASIPDEIEDVSLAPQFGNIYTVDFTLPSIGTTAGVLSLYDKLVEDYPKLLSKSTLTSGSFTNYEYIFSTGNYNTKGARSRDSVIAKPKVLIMSGIHGDERSAVVGLYHLVKAMCEHVYSLNAITDFCEFRIIPVVNPYGYDNNSRLNSNGVNINRNFDSPNWELTSTGDDYSGAAPGDQLETQVIQDWLIANQDAAVFVDCHNSGNQNELACLLGLSDAAHLAAKRQFLYSINKIIPYLKKRRNIQDFNTFSYTGNTSTTGASKAYGEYKGIMSYTYEMSINIDQHGRNGAFTNAAGSELIGAMLKGLVKYVLLKDPINAAILG